MGQKKFAYRSLAVATLLALSTGGAQASGFSVPEISIAGTAMSNALVANHELLGAIPYNPSLAAFHSGTTVSGGINVVHAESEVTPAIGTSNNFQGMDNVFIPMVQVTHQLNDAVTLGFGTSVPFGLSTKYPLGTFGILAALDPGAPLSAGALQPTESKVEIIDIAPTVAFKIGDNTAVAIGADVYWLREVIFDTQDIQNEGDGTGYGWNASISHVAGPWSFGASYHSRSEIDIEGTTTVPLLGGSPASATFIVPWRAQIGVRYQVNKQLAVEADISRTGWNSFQALNINNGHPGSLGTISSVNNWDDANAYRLSGSYDLSEQTQLRFGYTRDMTGQGDDFFSARTADSDRHLFSIGLGHDLGDGLQIEASYMLVKFDDRTLATTVPFGTYGSDPNGTSAYNGTYETTVHLLGVGLSKRFDL